MFFLSYSFRYCIDIKSMIYSIIYYNINLVFFKLFLFVERGIQIAVGKTKWLYTVFGICYTEKMDISLFWGSPERRQER